MNQDDEFLADIVLESFEPERYEFSASNGESFLIVKCRTYAEEVLTIQFNAQLIKDLHRCYLDSLDSQLHHELEQSFGKQYETSSIHQHSEDC